MISSVIEQVGLSRAIETCDMAPDLYEIDIFQGTDRGIEGLDEREGRLVGKRLGEQGSKGRRRNNSSQSVVNGPNNYHRGGPLLA